MAARRSHPAGPEPVGCDTSEMLVIHRLFRLAFTDAPGLVRGVHDGDAERTAVVADHVSEIAASLHHHHQTEDELLWDRLEGRAPGCAVHVGLMRSQHAAVGERLDALSTEVAQWRRTAAAPERERVAGTLDEILRLLVEHLGDEEQRVLPVASETMTQREWDALGEHARATIPRDRRLIQLGWILASFQTAAEREEWVRQNLPLPVRALFAVVGRRQFEAHRRRVLGEQTPA